MRKRKGAHDKTVDEVVRRLNKNGEYGFIFKEKIYYKSRRQINPFGEIDAGGFRLGKKRYGVFVEVKSSNSYKNRKKAIFQLRRDNRYFTRKFELNRTFMLYAYPTKQGVKYERIK
jgi:hypothetical protein